MKDERYYPRLPQDQLYCDPDHTTASWDPNTGRYFIPKYDNWLSECQDHIPRTPPTDSEPLKPPKDYFLKGIEEYEPGEDIFLGPDNTIQRYYILSANTNTPELVSKEGMPYVDVPMLGMRILVDGDCCLIGSCQAVEGFHLGVRIAGTHTFVPKPGNKPERSVVHFNLRNETPPFIRLTKLFSIDGTDVYRTECHYRKPASDGYPKWHHCVVDIRVDSTSGTIVQIITREYYNENIEELAVQTDFDPNRHRFSPAINSSGSITYTNPCNNETGSFPGLEHGINLSPCGVGAILVAEACQLTPRRSSDGPRFSADKAQIGVSIRFVRLREPPDPHKYIRSMPNQPSKALHGVPPVHTVDMLTMIDGVSCWVKQLIVTNSDPGYNPKNRPPTQSLKLNIDFPTQRVSLHNAGGLEHITRYIRLHSVDPHNPGNTQLTYLKVEIFVQSGGGRFPQSLNTRVSMI